MAAIEQARKIKATLVIAKLDRLSRNASFIFTLKDSGVDFVCADMPDANTLTIGIFAVLAQHERELISSRTKAALQAKIAQGAKLGKPENLTYQDRVAGARALKEKASTNHNNKRAAAMIELYRSKGLSWLAIAGKLNEAGFRASRGGSFRRSRCKEFINVYYHLAGQIAGWYINKESNEKPNCNYKCAFYWRYYFWPNTKAGTWSYAGKNGK
ncbi:recombinase family protein [Adhaeribacter arboris]|uniref:recombinase family protein n=1 Tax=Adhaeribacter arboris TaxID=2072846 RepID=UPI001E35F318|nr:recombinase family protein [Adhaeribacter arboris]